MKFHRNTEAKHKYFIVEADTHKILFKPGESVYYALLDMIEYDGVIVMDSERCCIYTTPSKTTTVEFYITVKMVTKLYDGLFLKLIKRERGLKTFKVDPAFIHNFSFLHTVASYTTLKEQK